MDNTSPRKGDTRYIPLNWTVINTNTWTGAPYTGSFGMAKSGSYTLKVAFKLQQYNGSAWTNAEGSDTKQVPFRISKAKVTAPGLDLTPAANRRNAVKTGDSTPILPFVIILIAAVVVIEGFLFTGTGKNKKMPQIISTHFKIIQCGFYQCLSCFKNGLKSMLFKYEHSFSVYHVLSCTAKKYRKSTKFPCQRWCRQGIFLFLNWYQANFSHIFYSDVMRYIVKFSF